MLKFFTLLLPVFLMLSQQTFSKEISVYTLVKTPEMATELAYIYVKYIYGKEKAQFQKPYSITDGKTVWKIEGKQPQTLGGNFTILIAKEDGRVLDVTHTK